MNEELIGLLREAHLERPEAIMVLRRKAADEIERLTKQLVRARKQLYRYSEIDPVAQEIDLVLVDNAKGTE